MTDTNITPLQTLKGWFENGKKPTQEQFWAWMESFFHKSEVIPVNKIDGLDGLLQGKANSDYVDALYDELAGLINDKLDTGKGYTYSIDKIKELISAVDPLKLIDDSLSGGNRNTYSIDKILALLKENIPASVIDDALDEGSVNTYSIDKIKELIGDGSDQDLQGITNNGNSTNKGLVIIDPENANNKITIEKGTITFQFSAGKEGDPVIIKKTVSLNNGVIDIREKYNDSPEKSVFKAGAEGVILNNLIKVEPTKLLAADDEGNIGLKGIDEAITSQFNFIKNYHSTFFTHSFNGAALTDYFVLQSSKKKVSNLIIRGRLIVEGAYQSFEVVGNLNNTGFTSCFYKTSKSENLIDAIGLCYYQDSLTMLWIKGTDTYKSKYTNIIFDQIVAFEGSMDLDWIDEGIMEMKPSTMFESLITAKIQAQLFDSSGWLTMTLTTGYKATQYDEPQYKREGTRVYLRGSFTGAETLSNQFANLPIGFRPKTKKYVLGESTPYAISITPVGNMLRSETTQTTIKLDGYYFDVD